MTVFFFSTIKFTQKNIYRWKGYNEKVIVFFPWTYFYLKITNWLSKSFESSSFWKPETFIFFTVCRQDPFWTFVQTCWWKKLPCLVLLFNFWRSCWLELWFPAIGFQRSNLEKVTFLFFPLSFSDPSSPSRMKRKIKEVAKKMTKKQILFFSCPSNYFFFFLIFWDEGKRKSNFLFAEGFYLN